MPGLALLERDQDNAPGTHLLSCADVGAVIQNFGPSVFISELSDEIASVYQDPQVEGSDRTGWTKGVHTTEVMLASDARHTVSKLISSNPANADVGLPTVNGTMFMYESGQMPPVLICDATLITSLRTATTTSLVIDRLKPDTETLSIVGAGAEGEAHAAVAAMSLQSLKRILLQDKDRSKAEMTLRHLRAFIGGVLGDDRTAGIEMGVVGRSDPAIEREADAIVTATFGTEEALDGRWLEDGTVIAAVGADMAGKRELTPAIYERTKFVTDEMRQSLREGELQHAAPFLGVDSYQGVYGHRGSLFDGRIIGISELLADQTGFMERAETLTVYDSTGFAGQDLATGKLLLRILRARSED